MNKTFLADLEPLQPVNFFNLELEGRLGKEFLLPDTSFLLGETPFGEIALLLQKEAIIIKAKVHKPFEESFYPAYEKGDSLELFFDTRDLKTAGFMTRFCHHFVILPVEVEGVMAREITRFRTEDVHSLCDPAEIEVKTDFASSSYSLNIYLPVSCLHGYDPLSFHRLGFTYKLNRFRGEPQHFALSSHFYNIVQHPSYWASIEIKS